jgi:hypothetical protein
MSLFNQLLEVQRRFQRELMAKAGVIGVGIGYRDVKGERTNEVTLVALVEQKVPIDSIPPQDRVPEDINGLRTDVIEVGKIVAQLGPRDRYRPVIPVGVSIGHYKVTAGTIGAIVYDRVTNEPLILSNNHVLANSNDALIGDPILQPASVDRGQNPADVVARLERFKALRYIGDPDLPEPPPPVVTPIPTTPTPPTPTTPTTPTSGCDIASMIAGFGNALAKANGSEKRLTVTNSQSQAATTYAPTQRTTVAQQETIPENLLDCALAKPINPSMFSAEIRNIGPILGVGSPRLGMQIRKTGRTSDTTQGVVNLINATIDVGYNTLAGPRTARFVNQIIASGMSQGGDSGSLIVELNSQTAVGLLFAGSGTATIFTPIERILAEMNVQFAAG